MTRRANINDYSQANTAVMELEQREAAMVLPVCTMADVIDTLIPLDIQRICKAAYNVVQGASHERFRFPITTTTEECLLWVVGSLRSIQMAAPELGVVPNVSTFTVRPGPFADYLQELLRLRTKWDKVRTVVSWFTAKRATPSCVKAYWPTMGALIPSHVALHEVNGFYGDRPQPAGMGDMLPLFRETRDIVATATLLPKYEHTKDWDLWATIDHNMTYSEDRFRLARAEKGA